MNLSVSDKLHGAAAPAMEKSPNHPFVRDAGDEASVLSFDRVSYQYSGEDFDIVDGLSFDVKPGSFHCILGVSGCGKSTIFRMTNGLLPPKKGTIRVNGTPVGGQGHYCGYMPQKDMLFPWRSVGENLALPLEIQRRMSKGERRARIEAALAEVGLAGCADKRPDELSGGMRQRAAFARTMLTGSDLLLLDEPFSALDFLTRISMQEWLLEQWQKTGKTILFITHDVEEALFLSSSVLVVEEIPIRSLREIPVPLGYPRSRKDLARPEIIELREELIGMLRKQVAE